MALSRVTGVTIIVNAYTTGASTMVNISDVSPTRPGTHHLK